MTFSPKNIYARPVRLLIILSVITFVASLIALGQLSDTISTLHPPRWDYVLLIGLGISWIVIIIYHTRKPLPSGLSYKSQLHKVPIAQVAFFRDLTYVDKSGQIIHEQEIFEQILKLIRGAQSYILLDMFLFNSFPGRLIKNHRTISQELTDSLIAQKKVYPGMRITVITDPLNTVYGGYTSPEFSTLENHDIHVITTNLKPLRDSNPFYSGLWRLALQWFGNSKFMPLLPHPFAGDREKVTLRSYLTAFNAKGNHRKVIIADTATKSGDSRTLTALVTSANIHDGSSWHSNVAVVISEHIAHEINASEKAVASLSQTNVPIFTETVCESAGPLTAQLLTEGKISQAIQTTINQSIAGDCIDIVMFALGDRQIITVLLAASARGVIIRIILDPSQEAFGYPKNGIPNQPVAWELLKRSKHRISIRWYATHGEQCHSKFFLRRHDTAATLIVGSANFTRRNLRDYNLELDVSINGPQSAPALTRACDYFETIWNNQGGNTYTIPYEAQTQTNIFKFIRYWFQEITGLSAN